ncbi:MAG: hypothetical protein ACOX6V_01050 [Patescibacteria group bacterium]|jgi:hypothetical protein
MSKLFSYTLSNFLLEVPEKDLSQPSRPERETLPEKIDVVVFEDQELMTIVTSTALTNFVPNINTVFVRNLQQVDKVLSALERGNLRIEYTALVDRNLGKENDGKMESRL